MSHFNNAILIGHASRYNFGTTSNGNKYCSFKLLVVDKLGQKEAKNYFNVTCYGGIADVLERYQEDNKHMLVDGRINPITDAEGNSWFEIVASQIKFL